jgi:hypothetical protein
MRSLRRFAAPTLAVLAVAALAAPGLATPPRRLNQTPMAPAAAGPAGFAERVAAAHAASVWAAHQAIAADIVIQQGGEVMLAGTMTTTTDASRSRLWLKDGSNVVFDGEEAWVAPWNAPVKHARFHATTWPYFLAAPYRLADQDTRLRVLGRQPFGGGSAVAARLTFLDGTMETSDDWFVAYREDGSDRLVGLAYGLTFGRYEGEAERPPYAIVYGDWMDVDGVPLATTWTFYAWSIDEGTHGDPVGTATLRNIRFVDDVTPLTFQRPGNARAATLPRN